MKKIILPIVAAVSSMALHVHAQVGVNTDKPASTFDITAKNATGTTKNVDGLLIPRVDRERAQNMSSVPTSTLIYINSATTGSQTGTAINIDAAGYYYYNGTAWTKLTSTGSNNIYNTDGTLTGNRIVTQGTNTLAFNGSAVNAFSVDGTTFSVDAANDRVGIGTNNPQAQLHLGQTLGNRKIVMHDGYSDDNTFYGFGVNPYTLRYQVPIIGAAHVFFAGNGSNSNELFRINGNGNVGIGTSTPQKMFHVTGASQFGNEINVGGTATTTGSPGTAGQVLTSAGAGAPPTWTTPAAVTSTNIYNADGTLTGNRTVAQGINTLAFTGAGNMGIGTATPQKRLHVDGDLQITKELNVGGSGTAAGSAGTAGQILTSAGAGAAPTWTTPAVVTSTNIYNTDGTLTGNRIVTQGANTLAFNGTAVNAFSVDGSTFSVDAANNKVGIGTTTPHGQLQFASVLDNRKVVLYESVNNDNQYAGFGIGASLLRYQVGETGSDHGFFAGTGATTSNELMRIKGNGNVGIGTSNPQKKLHVDGDLQITKELNVGGSGTVAGSAGTAGQILTSSGAGAAPTWTTPAAVTSTNIYNTDGTLTGNRIVTQGANTIAFNGTAVNAFSVDGGTLSVDAANDRVGIGKTAPQFLLDLGNQEGKKISLYNDSGSNFWGFGLGNNALDLYTANNKLMTLGTTNVGIGTSTPQKKLHVDGDLQITKELNVGGSGTVSGSAGTAGQILTSAGAGAAPTWATPAVTVDTNTNIYNTDGTILTNRTVAQADKTLAFTTDNTKVNAFSVDSGTLSVDALNNRVGIGNTTPNSKFFVRGSNSQPVAGTLNPDALVRIDGGTGHHLDIGTLNDNPWGSYINSLSYGSETGMNLSLNSVGGNVGIGTLVPQRTMHVNGSLQVTNELNVGGSGNAAGSAGTTGQVLTSAGAGAAPTWTTPAAVTSTNIYNADGSLNGNRTVTQGANTLAFNGTAVNAFSVDGTTLSVDAANNRVGIGTNTPHAPLQLGNGLGNRKLVLYEGSNDDHQFYGFGVNDYTLRYQSQADHVFYVSSGSTSSTELFRVNRDGNVAVGTATPQKKFHVNGTAQFTNEINVGGSASTAGSPGTAGQVLMSNGAGAAPKWGTLADVTPTSTGSVLVVDGKFIIAQEISVQMTDNFSTTTSGVATAIGNLTNEIIDNENKFNGTATGNSFTVSADGTYQLTMNALLTDVTTNSYPVIGVFDDTANQWIARVNDQYMSTGSAPTYPKVQTYSLIVAFPMLASHTYSFRVAASQDIATVKSHSVANGAAGTPAKAPATQMSLKRLK